MLRLLFLVAACQTTQPCVDVRTVQVSGTVPCVNRDDSPLEPEQVGDQFSDDAKHDLGMLRPSALELRKWRERLGQRPWVSQL